MYFHSSLHSRAVPPSKERKSISDDHPFALSTRVSVLCVPGVVVEVS